MHRFVWDLRYPQAKGARAPFRRPSGPLALPGNYTVQLTARGKNSTQTLTVKMDPRVKAPQEELVRQFELASKLTAREGEVSLALQQIAELCRQIEARKKEASEKADVVDHDADAPRNPRRRASQPVRQLGLPCRIQKLLARSPVRTS